VSFHATIVLHEARVANILSSTCLAMRGLAGMGQVNYFPFRNPIHIPTDQPTSTASTPRLPSLAISPIQVSPKLDVPLKVVAPIGVSTTLGVAPSVTPLLGLLVSPSVSLAGSSSISVVFPQVPVPSETPRLPSSLPVSPSASATVP
jgi:hypothetical protein